MKGGPELGLCYRCEGKGYVTPPLNKSPTPEHVEGDGISADHIADAGKMVRETEATRWSAIGVGLMAADPEGRWVSIRDFDQARSAEAQLEEARKVLATVFEDILTRTRAGMVWGLNGHSTLSPTSTYALSRLLSTIGEKPDAE